MSEDLNVKIGGDAAGAVRAMDTVRDRAREMAQDIVSETAKMAASIFGFEKALEGVKESMLKGDEVRDLANSLAIYTGSIKNATETLRFFEEAQKQSRNTADEMAHAYRDLLPQAMSRGFSQESMRPITQWLSQLGTISHKTFDEMEHGFQQILAGRARATNPVLEALGITKTQIANLGWDQLIAKMEEVTGHFPEMGQSFESLMHKMKDSILDNIGGGINEALGGGHGLADNLKDAFDSPEMVSTLHNVGEFIGNILKGDIIAAISGGEIEKKLQDIRDAPWFHYDTNKNQVMTSVRAMLPMLGGQGVGTRGTTGSWGAEGEWGGAGSFNLGGLSSVGRYSNPTMSHEALMALEDAKRAGKVAVDAEEKARKEALAEEEKFWKQREEGFREAAKIGSWKNVNRDILTPKGLLDQQQADEAAKLFNDGLTKYNGWSLEAGKTFAQVAAEELRLRIHDELIGGLANDFVSLGSGGGKGFMAALSNEFPSLMTAGAKKFAEKIFGARGDGLRDAQGNYLPGHDPNQVYGGWIDAKKYPNAAAGAQTAMTVGSIGFGAYQAGQQGTSPGRAALEGAMAGASTGSYVAAIVSAVVAAGAAYVGGVQTREEYKYAVPHFDDQGGASLDRPGSRVRHIRMRNVPNQVTDPEADQMIADMQDVYDRFRNQYTRLAIKLGDQIPTIGDVGGKIQDAPSAHFMEHFQLWMKQELPRDIADQFHDEMRGGFGKLGLSGGQFDSMMQKYDRLDPAKAASMLSGLADALIKFNDASKFLGADFGMNLYDVQKKATQTFAQSLAETDPKILQFASHLKDLVGEDQITAANELGDMMTQRMEAEKQFLQEINSALKAGKAAADSLADALGLRLMHKADGTPDYEKQAQFFRTDAERQLGLLQGATNANDAQKYLDRYLSDLDKISQAGFGIGSNTGDDWTKWAQDQINTGQHAFDDVLHALGDATTSADAKFLAAIQPSIDAFKGSLGGTNVVIGDFGGALSGVTPIITEFGATLAAVIPILRTLTGSDSGFGARTTSARARS